MQQQLLEKRAANDTSSVKASPPRSRQVRPPRLISRLNRCLCLFYDLTSNTFSRKQTLSINSADAVDLQCTQQPATNHIKHTAADICRGRHAILQRKQIWRTTKVTTTPVVISLRGSVEGAVRLLSPATQPSALCFDEERLMRVASAVYAMIHVGRAPTSESLSHADPRPLGFKSCESC